LSHIVSQDTIWFEHIQSPDLVCAGQLEDEWPHSASVNQDYIRQMVHLGFIFIYFDLTHMATQPTCKWHVFSRTTSTGEHRTYCKISKKQYYFM